MSIAGTAMVFTPLFPVGAALLGAGAAVGVTTVVGDGVGSYKQKETMKRGLKNLGEAAEAFSSRLGGALPALNPNTPRFLTWAHTCPLTLLAQWS